MPENCDPPFPADQKVAILRRHLVDRIPINDLCEEYKIDSTLFYKWQTQFFENGSTVFARNTKKTRSQHQKNHRAASGQTETQKRSRFGPDEARIAD